MSSTFSEGYDPDFFARHCADSTPLPLAAKVCRAEDGEIDCPVLRGMYRGISNDLKRCDHDLVVRYSRSWFSHSQRGLACRGNALNQGRVILRLMQAASDEVGEPVRSAEGAEPQP